MEASYVQEPLTAEIIGEITPETEAEDRVQTYEEPTETKCTEAADGADGNTVNNTYDGDNRTKPEIYTSPSDISKDIAVLCETFPDISGGTALSAVNSKRYGELRALGLSPREAYLATNDSRNTLDNRSHLVTTVPSGSIPPTSGMTQVEMAEARRLFGDLSDAEIKKLYNKVTK